jgi:hypothetical protein
MNRGLPVLSVDPGRSVVVCRRGWLTLVATLPDRRVTFDVAVEYWEL